MYGKSGCGHCVLYEGSSLECPRWAGSPVRSVCRVLTVKAVCPGLGEGKVAALSILRIGRTPLRHVLGWVGFGLVREGVFSWPCAAHLPGKQTLCFGEKMTSNNSFGY